MTGHLCRLLAWLVLRRRHDLGQMVDLTWSARGRLAGFVAFDPRRPDALEHVQQAIGAGLVGVKIYPPMGYRPLDARYLDAFVTLYTWCSGQGIPVLAHCSATGFEAWMGHGTYSDPGGDDGQGWDAFQAPYGHQRGAARSL